MTNTGSLSRLLVAAIAFCVLGGFVGCGSKTAATSPTDAVTTPVANRAVSVDSALPSDENLLRQIDEALEYTYDRRRLSVGSTSNDQAAWQIIHGALAFKREFLVTDGSRDIPVVDYILSGGKMKGLDLRRGDLLDDNAAGGATKRYGIATVV